MSQHCTGARPAFGWHQRTGAARTPAAGRRGRRVPDGMVICVDPVGDGSTARLIGDLDLASATHVRWALPRMAGRELVVDLSRLSFMDAAGLSSLLLVRRHFEETGRRLRISGARGGVRRVFELSGLGHLVEDAA